MTMTYTTEQIKEMLARYDGCTQAIDSVYILLDFPAIVRQLLEKIEELEEKKEGTDYRQLLKDYMADIMYGEGTDFLMGYNFNDKEGQKALEEISLEIRAERNPYR